AAGIAGGDGAEAAAAGAGVAQQHHGGGALAPALAHVGTARLLADRVEVEGAERLLEVVVRVAAGRAHLEPLGLRREPGHRPRVLARIRRGRSASHCEAMSQPWTTPWAEAPAE